MAGLSKISKGTHQISFRDLDEILLICREMIKKPHTWENRRVFPIYRRSNQLESDFKEQTRQLTHGSRILEVETRCRLSPMSGRLVSDMDQTVCLELVGYGFQWIALGPTIDQTSKELVKKKKSMIISYGWKHLTYLCMTIIFIQRSWRNRSCWLM